MANRATSRNTELLEIDCFYIIVKVRNVIIYIKIHISLHLNMVDNALKKIKTSVLCCAEV